MVFGAVSTFTIQIKIGLCLITNITENMKSRNLMLGAILFILMGCGVDKSDSLVTVDVTANYPKKELVFAGFYGCGIYSVGDDG